jgi:hypothetical protein
MKPKSKSKKKADQAFMKKLQGLSFSVGGKVYSPAPKKPKGKPQFTYLGSALFTITRHPRTPEERQENEQALSE